jgi:IclR family KDG regulon transcriptional repressor
LSTLEKALDILEIILHYKKEISIIDLAKSAGLSASTTHRILSILCERGYVYQKHKGAKYSLGYKFLLYDQISDIEYNFVNIKQEATPFLEELSEKTSETIVLTIFDGREPVDIMAIVPDMILKASTGIGTKSPLHCTAVGKMFLACMPDENINKILNSYELILYTENTIVDIDRLKVELDNARTEGVAYDDEEYIVGLRSAAAPIILGTGQVIACIYFFGPTARVSLQKMKQIGTLVKNCASEISKKMTAPRKY